MICDKCTHAERCPAKAEYGGAIRCSAFKPMTNEEWFCQLSTEEKAKVLNDLYWDFDYKGRLYYNFETTEKSYERWLKQPHREE